MKKIGSGGYGDVYYPPRYPKKYAGNKAYVQRYTEQTKTQIQNGEIARKIFDPKDVLSIPIHAIYPRKNDYFSEIMLHKPGDLEMLMLKYYYGHPKLFRESVKQMKRIMVGLERLHKKKWVHRDIKLNNFLYDTNPLRYFLIDWGTALPSCKIYDDNASNWHMADNQNLPPEYKSYAYFRHHMRFDDFAKEYTKNRTMHHFLSIDPHYEHLLKEAHKKIQHRLRTAKDPHKLMESIATKADVFAMGLVLVQLYDIWGRGNAPPELLRILRGMIDPDPFRRWSIRRVNREMRSIS